MVTFGSPTPRQLGNTASVPTFPQAQATYTGPTGSIIVPPGAMDRWYAYRATLGAVRGDVVVIGDSTTFGASTAASYSWLQRLRDRSVAFGMIDGGKGMFAGNESEIAYDAPEVNATVSSTFDAGLGTDAFDNTDGQYYFDQGAVANHQLVLQFRTTDARLWYSARDTAGDFTYSIDGGATTTVKAFTNTGINPRSQYVHITGLTANTTHTITITNLAVSTNGGPASNAKAWIAFAPMNATGVVYQKFATTGDTIKNHYYGGLASSPWTSSINGMRFQTPFGLASTTVASPNYTGALVDSTQPAAGKINPVLGISHLAFNDLTGASGDDPAFYTEYVKRFAGVCTDAGCPGIIISGQLPYNAQWPTYGAARFNAMKAQALASGLVFVDLFYPVAGPSLAYTGGTNSPHLPKAQYVAQADFIWDNLLGLT